MYLNIQSNLCFTLIVFISTLIPTKLFSQSVFYDDSDPTVIVVGNETTYEIAFSKNTGSILYIKDKKTNANLILGHEVRPMLWTAVFEDWSLVESREYNPESNNTFNYSWDELTSILTLDYIPDQAADPKITAKVKVEVHADDCFDLQLQLTNESGKTIREIEFHHNLGLTLGTGDRVLIPFGYPGIMLGSDFFSSNDHMFLSYPGMLVDYFGFEIEGSLLTVYTPRDSMFVLPTFNGLQNVNDFGNPNNYALIRRYMTWVNHDSTWVSPVSRFRFGKSHAEGVSIYKEENAIGELPGIQEKLGEQFELISKSPLYLYAFAPWEPPGFLFSEFAPTVEPFPKPSVMMLSMYYMYGFPGYSPDYLPPVPFLGSTQDFADMVDSLQAQERLVMPFTHSVFWHELSPTLQNLPPGISLQDVGMINEDGTVDSMLHWNGQFNIWDKYYSASPYSPYVQHRLSEVYSDIFDVYGCDIMYQDVIGTLGDFYDFNGNSPSPTHFIQGWLQYLRQFKNYPSVTEWGYDRLAEVVTGIMGTNHPLIYYSGKGWDYDKDDGYWRSYPFTPFWYGDKIINYNWGWRAEEITTGHVAWNLFYNSPLPLALGDVFPWTAVEEEETWAWSWIFHDFQSHVLSRTIGHSMDEFADLDGPGTRAVYGDITIIRNWDQESAYDVGEHTISPEGAWVFSDSGDLFAGMFNRVNGQNLSGSDHYLICRTFPDSIILHHPKGMTTPFRIQRPAEWTQVEKIQIHEIWSAGVEDVFPAVDEDYIEFSLGCTVQGKKISHYRITYDTVAPVLIGVPEDISVNCEDIPAPAAVTAEDNLDPSLTVEFNEVNHAMEGCGTITRTWVVSDNGFNTTSLTQTITVTDSIAPLIIGVPADSITDCAAVPSPPVVTAEDNCDPTLSVTFEEVNNVVEGCGTVTRIWTVHDDCGNVTSRTQTIQVEDHSAPELTGVPPDTTVHYESIPDPAIVTAIDNCDPTLFVDFEETNNVVDQTGTILRTWSTVDNCVNTVSSLQIITVRDTTTRTIDRDRISVEFSLDQNYPNPFAKTTRIHYYLNCASLVELDIINLSGEKICSLVNTLKKAGKHVLTWEGEDENGMDVPSGIYMIRLKAGAATDMKKMVLIK